MSGVDIAVELIEMAVISAQGVNQNPVQLFDHSARLCSKHFNLRHIRCLDLEEFPRNIKFGDIPINLKRTILLTYIRQAQIRRHLGCQT